MILLTEFRDLRTCVLREFHKLLIREQFLFESLSSILEF